MSKKKIESESFIKKLKRKIDSPSFITELGIVYGILMLIFLFVFDIYLEDYYSSFSSWYRTFIARRFFWVPLLVLGSLELVISYIIEFFTKKRYDDYLVLLIMVIMEIYYIFIIASVIFFERGRDIIDYLIRHYC